MRIRIVSDVDTGSSRNNTGKQARLPKSSLTERLIELQEWLTFDGLPGELARDRAQREIAGEEEHRRSESPSAPTSHDRNQEEESRKEKRCDGRQCVSRDDPADERHRDGGGRSPRPS